MTTAFDVPQIFDGKTVVVLGSSPSMSRAVADKVRNMPRIVINSTWRLAPDADILFAHDLAWWQQNPEAQNFRGLKISGQDGEVDALHVRMPEERVTIGPGHVVDLKNSGIMAIRLAAAAGAKRIILFGIDFTPGHWHSDHPAPLAKTAPETLPLLSVALDCVVNDLAAIGVEVTGMPRLPLVVDGMLGLGDSIHQRAIVRELAQRYSVWLKTPYPQIYHDMPDIRLLPTATTMRTLRSNEQRNAHLYTTELPPPNARVRSCGYFFGDGSERGSVLGALARSCGVPIGDFRMSIDPSWLKAANAVAKKFKTTKPIMIFRPLIERHGMRGVAARNPDHAAYATIFKSLRDHYFVVSVADIKDDEEWIVGETCDADATFNHGELNVETIAALVSMAALVFCSPGFMTIMAQAVGTKSICVFGGYESAKSFSYGATLTPWLAIEPITPCGCWTNECQHDKTIDIDAALLSIADFMGRI